MAAATRDRGRDLDPEDIFALYAGGSNDAQEIIVAI
jgi:hypothetical protein